MRYLFLLIPLLFVPQHSASQKIIKDEFKYLATYQLTYQPDSTDVNSVRSEAMVLYLGDKISRFASAERSRGDSILRHRKKNPSQFTGSFGRAPQTEFDYYVYKGIPEGQLSYTRKIVKNNFQYVEDLSLFEWEILPETKEIAGYKAQKATTIFAGRDYLAWFTPEIPIPEGPYKFNGLPDLIVEVRDQKDHYSFVLKGFKKVKTIPFEFNSKDYITTNKRKFHEVVEEYNSDPFAAMERHGITFGFASGQKERMERERKERLRKENNPIELE